MPYSEKAAALRRCKAVTRAGDPAASGRFGATPSSAAAITGAQGRLDANALRRRVLAEGADPWRVRRVELTHGRDGCERTDAAGVVAEPDPRYGWRLWLLCPRCASRRVHLYHTRSGVACRACLRIGYGR